MSKRCCKTCAHYQSDSGECWGSPPLAQMVPTVEPDVLSGKVKQSLVKWTFFPQPHRDSIDKIVCGGYSEN